MPTRAARAAVRPRSARIDYGFLLRGTFAVFVFSGFVAFIEPSPYDILFFVALPLWFLGGFTMRRTVVPLLAVVFAYELGGFISLIPHLDETDPRVFMLLSLYLGLTAIVFALYFAEDSERRLEICLQAYAASTVVAAIFAIIGYLGFGGLGEFLSRYGRASGTFKDPNVLGSYLVLGAVYLIQNLVLLRTRHMIATGVSLFIVIAGIFLSFSRGSWGAFVVAAALCIGLGYATSSDARVRRRIVMMALAAVALAAVAVLVLLAFSEIRDLFLQRAALEQDYDSGATGRFGNQLRSLPLLLDNINGLGPLRFRLIFGLEPHDTYINAFASYGWLGGFAFLLLVGLTSVVGFRVSIVRSPYRRLAQVVWPSLLVFFLQAFQIDIDHWRHVFLLLGAVWGLESARMRWEGRPHPVRTPADAMPALNRS